MRRIRNTFIVAAVLASLVASSAEAATRTRFAIPAGYRPAAWERLGDGLDHVTIRRDGSGAQAVHVARLRPGSRFALRAVVSGQAVGGGLETTSSMCRRVRCLAGINGDFFSWGSGEPVGGLSIFGQAIRSPVHNRPQLVIGGGTGVSLAADIWRGLVTLADGRSVTLDGVNAGLRGGKVSLFTAAYGKTTGLPQGTTEIRVQITQPRPPLRLGETARIRFLDIRHVGNAPIPGDGAVLAANGAAAQALDTIWWQMSHGRLPYEASVRVESSGGARDSIGGGPVLLRDGRRAFTIVPKGLVQGRHPRTIVGWNREGEVFLVTVDGRQPGYAEGMTLLEATALMARMGATDAINLDGGGSTTFVSRGRVANSPAEAITKRVRRHRRWVTVAVGRRERAVATALVIVPVALPKKAAAKPGAPAGIPGDRRFLPAPDDPAPPPQTVAPVAALGAATFRDRLTAVAFALAVLTAATTSRRIRRRRRRSA